MEHKAVAVAPSPKAAHIGFAHMARKTRMQCPDCKERFEAGKGSCYCHELHRRRAYDQERARKGLAALYRPPSMR
jgi:hypothetical protein